MEFAYIFYFRPAAWYIKQPLKNNIRTYNCFERFSHSFFLLGWVKLLSIGWTCDQMD